MSLSKSFDYVFKSSDHRVTHISIYIYIYKYNYYNIYI